jgi:hypothetical protein
MDLGGVAVCRRLVLPFAGAELAFKGRLQRAGIVPSGAVYGDRDQDRPLPERGDWRGSARAEGVPDWIRGGDAGAGRRPV